MIRDFFIFQMKLLLDGLKDVVLLQLSVGALVLDVLRGRGRQPRLFYQVVRQSERFDLWLNLNGALERMEAGETEDGMFGASEAGADSLLGQVEARVRGGDRVDPQIPAENRTDRGLGNEEAPARGGDAHPGLGPWGARPR